jgi:hypothetical protein
MNWKQEMMDSVPDKKIEFYKSQIWLWFCIGPLSFQVAKIAVRRGINANVITVSWLILCLVAFFVMIFVEEYGVIYGVWLFAFAYFLDCIDGNIARISKNFSPLGAFLDDSGGNIFWTLFWVGLAIGCSDILNANLKTHSPYGVINHNVLLLSGFFSAILLNLRDVVSFRHSDVVRGGLKKSKDGGMIFNRREGYIIYANIMGYGGVLSPITLIASIIGGLEYILVLYALLYFVDFIYKYYRCIKSITII